MVNVFARFACQICDSRECWFRQLSSEATKQQFAEILGMRFDISQTFRSFRLHPIAYLYLLATRGLLGLRIRAPKPQGLPAPGSCVGQPSLFSAALRRGSAVGLLSGNHSTTSIVCWSAQPVLSFLAAARFRSQFPFFLTCSISPVFEALNRTLVEEKN